MMDESLHVCFLNLSFGRNSIGGVMNHMVALAKGLQSRGVSTSVICPGWGKSWRYVHEGVLDVIGIQEPRIDWKLAPAMIGFGWQCEQALRDLHREKPIHLIHLHDRPPFIGAMRARRHLGIPVIYTAHSCFHAGAEQCRHVLARVICRGLERCIARSGVPIIAVSDWTREGMIRLGASPCRVTTIANAVDVTAFPFAGPEERHPEEILFVGRFDHDKGLDVLLRAVQRLARERDVTLTAVGAGDLETRYRELARELGIADRVTFAGRLFGRDLVAAYQRAAVCVLPSRSEPFGMVMLEAMACGAPFVGTRVGGIAEVVMHEETGLLVAPEDPAAMVAAIARLLDDACLARGMAARARRMVEQRYSWETVAAETRGLYDRVIAANQSNARQRLR